MPLPCSATLFEAAAAAVARGGLDQHVVADGRDPRRSAPPPVVHGVPLSALEGWANGPSVSPKRKLLQQPFRKTVIPYEGVQSIR